MRILTLASAALTALALTACQPATEEPASAPAPQAEIQSTTAPSVGGPTELPTDGGVTPAPEAMEDATAEDVAAPASPAEAAVLSGGAQNPQNQ
ncbi:hypothetical protein BZG35_05315 [Brevundimonas sp. LM2]|uniref:hypothetical protein n=1 Tax=Brevundimonas sp. LM2 TaxID=1938605 RepID=UPI000983A466|nr:hypothetical protein [Brevundimonas sp. LM2]AQR61138.1 hypothetical protein BZG35_05315 [Brevundimonas sp. LM2]